MDGLHQVVVGVTVLILQPRQPVETLSLFPVLRVNLEGLDLGHQVLYLLTLLGEVILQFSDRVLAHYECVFGVGSFGK